ncbi:MAG TPA: serine/threonine-protein kinase, partial [Polyangiaceae bacterium]|nr:serine/threonine-protein kinase [Polyangiaceae bacterium]
AQAPPARLPPVPAPPPRSATQSISDGTLSSRVCPTCGGRFPADFRVCPRDAVPLEDAPEGDDPLVGQVLAGSYEVTRVLGEGGMGRVYEARHTRLTGKRFAVKLLHADLARQPEVVTRFQREAEAASGIAHINVVGVHDVNSTPEGQPYIVAELLQGEELGEYIERLGKVPSGDAVRIARQVCRALGAAHAQGIVHRDVKPENVFLTGDVGRIEVGSVKVIDFGISKVATSGGEALTKTGMVMGTPDYMAPEQARGDKVDARADIYAVGAILYRALTGKKPFEGLDPMATLTAVLTQEPDRPTAIEPGIPLALELIVQRAMAKSPKDRYQTMEELEADLAAFDPDILGRSSTAPPPDATPMPVDGSAKTILSGGRSPQRSRRSALAQTQMTARNARPGLLFFTFVGFIWLLANVVVAAGSAIRMGRGGGELNDVEIILCTVGAAGALVTPLVLWLRYLLREVWPNTPRAIELMGRIRRTVLYSAAAYAIATLFVAILFVVVQRQSVAVAQPVWSLLTFVMAALAAGGTWIATRQRH